MHIRNGLKNSNLRITLSLIMGFCSYFSSSSQDLGIGVSGAYNYTVPSYGGGVRVSILLTENITVSPQASMYFGKYQDNFYGLGASYFFSNIWKFRPYATAVLSYARWVNKSDYPSSSKSMNSVSIEPGVGFIIGGWGCFRPFVETRYNATWNEGNIQAGMFWHPGSCNVQLPSRSKLRCPAY